MDGGSDVVIVRTARLVIRPVLWRDEAEYVRVHELSREHFAEFGPEPEKPGQSEQERFATLLERTREGDRDGMVTRRVAVFADGPRAGRIAAVVSLHQMFKRSFGQAMASWRVSVDCVNEGIATEAMQGMLDAAFEPAPAEGMGLGLHRVQANIMPRNTASVRVAEKLGFRREGIARKYLKINGAWEDHVMYAQVADEHRPVYRAERVRLEEL